MEAEMPQELASHQPEPASAEPADGTPGPSPESKPPGEAPSAEEHAANLPEPVNQTAAPAPVDQAPPVLGLAPEPDPTAAVPDYAVAQTEEGPDRKRAKTDADGKARARSGRPNGVKCVCRCCGAQGFYQRSCGKKHQCLLGKCGTGAGGAWPGGPDMHIDDGQNSAVMYQVTCATCGTALQFALPDSPAYIVCYRCRAKMVIQPMASEVPGANDPAKPQSEAWPQNMIGDCSAQPE